MKSCKPLQTSSQNYTLGCSTIAQVATALGSRGYPGALVDNPEAVAGVKLRFDVIIAHGVRLRLTADTGFQNVIQTRRALITLQVQRLKTQVR